MGVSSGVRIGVQSVGLLLLAACNRDKEDPPPPPVTYSVGGTVSGLTGSVTLANNGGDARTVSANGTFTFATPLAGGANYAVTVTSQPANQTCTIGSGSGAIAASNVSSVAVNCVTNTVTVGGTITGLDGSVTLANNGGDARTVNASGAFTFATPINSGTNYNVTVITQPADQTCMVTSATGTASANVTNVAVDCVTYRVHASIGPAGGTVTGPGGAQVIIPAGALTQATDIGVARPPSGWPLPLPDDAPLVGSIYELTPHDLIFNKPVVIRLPVPAGAGNLGAFVATFGEDWMQQDVLQTTDFIELERNTFSWYSGFAMLDCAYSGPPRVGACSLPSRISGRSWATATPGNAIMMTSGGSLGVTLTNTYSPVGSAGTWAVDLDNLQTIHLSMEVFAAADCGSGHIQLKRMATGKPAQILYDVPAVAGITTIDVPRAVLDEGLTAYFLRYACTKQTGGERGGGDMITFDGRHAPNIGFAVGGPVTGLSGAGLELRLGLREIISVPAAASVFSFGTPLADGAAYEVSIRTQPQGVQCALANRIGAITSADVTNVAVTCTPTQSSTNGFAAVANRSSSNFSLFARVAPSGTLSLLDTPTTGGGPSAVAIHQNGIFTYIANQNGNSISMFRVRDPGAGSYAADNRGSVNTAGPAAMAIAPGEGRCMWVANNVNPSTVSAFELDTETGLLQSGSSVPSGLFPSAIAVHPGGQFVYTVNQAGNSISMYSANSGTCALTSIGTLANSVLAGTAIEVAPNGLFAYALGGSSIARFTIPANGQLTSAAFTSINGASGADDIVIRRDGKFLYAKSSNATGANLQVYSIDATTGALTLSSTLALPAQGFAQLAIDATGSALYATNMTTGNVHTFRVDGTTGSLTLIDTDQSGPGAQGIAVTP